MTSRQIAEALVGTPRTVETHLERIYAKLDIHSRAQLGVRFAEHGTAE
jgi:DNA-binding CsgD family transcriptional regulator